MAKTTIKIKNKEFEVDDETGEIVEINTKVEAKEVDWLNKKNARQSYLDAIADLDEQLETLHPGVTWDEIE